MFINPAVADTIGSILYIISGPKNVRERMARREDRLAIVVQSGLPLSACPFCTSTNVGFYEYVFAQQFVIMCNLCGAEGPRRSTHEEAAGLWNRRIQA